jgi:hypothetical protein
LFLIFVPALLAELLAPVCMFFSWFSATYAYNIFVDILCANIEIIKRVRSEYKIIERNININIPSLTTRISVIILPNSLVLSKASGLFLYPFIYLSRVFASITIILVFFWVILLILLVYLRKISFAKPGLRELLSKKNKEIIFYSKYIFFVIFLPLVNFFFCYYYV